MSAESGHPECSAAGCDLPGTNSCDHHDHSNNETGLCGRPTCNIHAEPGEDEYDCAVLWCPDCAELEADLVEEEIEQSAESGSSRDKCMHVWIREQPCGNCGEPFPNAMVKLREEINAQGGMAAVLDEPMTADEIQEAIDRSLATVQVLRAHPEADGNHVWTNADVAEWAALALRLAQELTAARSAPAPLRPEDREPTCWGSEDGDTWWIDAHVDDERAIDLVRQYERNSGAEDDYEQEGQTFYVVGRFYSFPCRFSPDPEEPNEHVVPYPIPGKTTPITQVGVR